MNLVETVPYKNYNINIYQDENAEDPRDNDNLGTMLCKHRRYDLGDVKASKDMDVDQIKEYVKRKDVISLPLYLYDHSGLTMRTGNGGNPFYGRLPQGHAEFDTSMVGYIIITYERIKREVARPKRLKKGQKNPDLASIVILTKKDRERVIRLLEGEVKEYSQYLEGDVYGYVIKKDGKSFGSCWGFYPDDDPLKGKHRLEYMLSDCRQMIDFYVKEAKKEEDTRENVTSA